MKIVSSTPELRSITSRAAPWLLAATALLVTRSSRSEPAKAALSVRLLELRNDKGKVGCALFASAKGFPDEPDAAAQIRWCPIADKTSKCSFDPIPEGIYAVVCFHDENGNGKLDTGLFGIPTEGVVASNHAKGTFGPPSFDDAKFKFRAVAAELRLKMDY